MVAEPTYRVLTLKDEKTFPLSGRPLARLEAFAHQADLDEQTALEVAITHALGCLQRRQAIFLDPLEEPAPRHKPRSSDE